MDNPTDLKRNKSKNWINNIILLCINGIGLGIIIGSLVTIFIPYFYRHKTNNFSDAKINFSFKTNKSNKFGFYNESNEISELSFKWKELAEFEKNLDVSAFITFEDGRYAKLNSEKSLPAASSIKIAILLIALEMLDKGDIAWNERIELNEESISSGPGWMRYQSPGNKFPLHEIATEMIRVGDNTAANLLINRIGGKNILNKRFQELGLKQTAIKDFMPDLNEGNSTSSKDLTRLIKLVDSRNILSPRSRDIFREIMSTSIENKLIPDGLLLGLGSSTGNTDYKLLIEGYRAYNKAGIIGNSYVDAALIEMPDGSRAAAAFIVKGVLNDSRAEKLIQDMSASIIRYAPTKQQILRTY